MAINAGLIVYNESNNIQIDSEYSNAVLIKSDQIIVSNFSTLTISAKFPLFFFRTVNGIFTTYKMVRTGQDTYTLVFYSDSASTIEYYVFDIVPPDKQLSNFGLQVFNEEGTIVYNSNAYYSHIVDNYTFPEFDPDKYLAWLGGHGPREIFSYVVPDSRTNKLAVMPLLAQRSVFDSPAIYLLYVPGYTTDGMTIRMSCMSSGFDETGSTPSSEAGLERNTVLVADVGSLPVPYNINT